MEKEDVLQIYNGILLNHKKELYNAIFSNVYMLTPNSYFIPPHGLPL